MLLLYINTAIQKACYKQLEDGNWFAEIPGFTGVWANGEPVEECRTELPEVLEEWLLLKIRNGDSLPAADGAEIRFKTQAGRLLYP